MNHYEQNGVCFQTIKEFMSPLSMDLGINSYTHACIITFLLKAQLIVYRDGENSECYTSIDQRDN